MADVFTDDCLRLREKSPLIHNITNYVAMNFSANALLACGASPLMSFCPEEMTDIVSGADAVAINIGCLDSRLIRASRIAAAAALQFGKPWVLDPAGAGASELRIRTATDLAINYKPSIIRGNASEITVLCAALGLVGCNRNGNQGTASLPEQDNIVGRKQPGIGSNIDCHVGADELGRSTCQGNVCPVSKGVDSTIDSSQAVDAAQKLAEATGSVVSMSGSVDYITDGTQIITIANGSPLMPRVTAMGCTATAITAAFAVVAAPMRAAVDAMALMGVCGEMAAAQSEGTGSLAVRFIDILSSFEPADIASKIRH